jgi:hypothetical protein
VAGCGTEEAAVCFVRPVAAGRYTFPTSERQRSIQMSSSKREPMTLTYKISPALIARYSAGPSATRTSNVKALHESIRDTLSEATGGKFDTFLQGSYRNDTAIADINDVDIVALYDPWRSPASKAEWTWLFHHVALIIRDSLLSGSVSLGDKCVKYEGSLKADIVPAISRSPYSSTDPIKIYSRSASEERDNYPRTHYANGVKKQAAARDTYKATVRLFKRWVRQYPRLVAPSFYIECTVHNVESGRFDSYLPLSFASVGAEILSYTRTTYIPSVAGDKDILVPSEWAPSDFASFQQRLQGDIRLVMSAMSASTQSEADRLWKLAFGD